MNLTNSRGLTLIESLVSIALVSVLILGVMGAFYVSKISTVRADHRMTALGLVREYLEKEIAVGYNFGTYSQSSSVTRTVDGISYTISPSPWPTVVGSEGGVSYRTVGFRVTWSELQHGSGPLACSERVVTYIAQH